jgi:hypothetical protein
LVALLLLALLPLLPQGVFALLQLLTGRDLRPAARPVEERSGQGTITIMPYDKQ